MSNKYLLLISIIAALLGCIADVFILYSPNGGYETGNYLFLKDIDLFYAKIGHFLGIFCIPLELLGLIAIHRTLPQTIKNQGFIIACLAVYITVPGVAYHALVSMLTIAIQNNINPKIIKQMIFLIEPLGAVLFLGLIIMTILLVKIIWNANIYPKYMIFFTPFSFYIYFILLYLFVPIIGNYTAVAGFNLSFACFYSIVYFKVE